MRFRACLILGGLTFALFAIPIFGQPGDKKPPEPKPGVKLPITRVVLFNAGIGYFHREGTVTDTTRVDLKVNEEDVNDLILTLVANDPTGTSRAVTYDNRAPADITLKAFSIDLTENPSVGNLLHQVRGEKVDITHQDGTVVTGNIVSVEKPAPTVIHPESVAAFPEGAARPLPVVLPAAAGAVEQVSLLTDDGLQTVALAKIKKVKFTKAELQAEFRKALEALAAARGANTKSVGVTFAGKGERKVSVGYIADAPLWKPTYRVMVGGEGGPKLVGLAAVENTTDEDWENVTVKLLSGRPMTYKMDLYDPLYIPRPVIEPELYASLRPPVYQGVAMQQLGGNMGFGGGQMGGFGGGQGGFGGQLGQVGNQGNLGVGGGIAGMVGMPMRGGYAPHMSLGGYGGIGRPSVRSLLGDRLDYDTRTNRLAAPPDPDMPKPPTNYLPGASDLKNLGESFEYAVKQPVNLPRFKSALLPILDEKIDAQRISIFNPEILGNHPLKGLRITNTSKLFVAQGPVTVYEGDTAAGQARLPDVKPGESRLLSYAIDLDVNVRKEPADDRRTPVSMRIGEQAITTVTRVKSSQKYAAFNKSAEAKTVWVTQPIKPNWKLVAPNKPVETTPELFRFEMKLAANDKGTLEVVEETDETTSVGLAGVSAEALEQFQRETFTPPAVKAAVGKVLAARQAQAETVAGIAEEQAALKEIGDEQTRIRANMAQAPKESEAFKRYLKKFDDQETEIEKRQAKLKELTKAKDRKAKELADLVRTLKAE